MSENELQTITSAKKGWRKIFIPVLVIATGFCFIFILLEIGMRVYHREFRFINFWMERNNLLKSNYPVQFHPLLGWIPRPGARGTKNFWKTEVNIGRDGIRENGNIPPVKKNGPNGVILAVGDSFTFGDQVSDSETWPSYLQRISGMTVLNGGVFGYGIDQSYLRMKMLAETYHPDMIIFGYTLPEFSRCEYSVVFSATKPYFSISDKGLELHTSHIKEPVSRSQGFRYLLGFSFFCHKFMKRVFPAYWMAEAWKNEKAHHQGFDVACNIYRQLGSVFQEHPHLKRIYILLQYMEETSIREYYLLEKLLKCIDDPRVQVIDSRVPLSQLRERDPEKYKKMYFGHMTSEGNRFTAEIINTYLQKEIATQ